MSELILKPLLNSPVLEITLTLPLPEGEALTVLKNKAKAAADGIGAAPEFVRTKDDLPNTVPFSLLELKLAARPEIPKNAFESFRVCVIQSQDSTVDGDLILEIVSGAVIINADSLSSVVPSLWSVDLNSQFGEIEKLVLVANGLIIETKKTNGAEVERCRFSLIKGDRLQPEEDSETRLIWEQIAWGDTSLAAAIYKTPSDRLKEIQDASDTRMNQEELRLKNPPVSRVGKFDIPTQSKGAVFVEIRNRNASGTTTTDVRERVTPSWGLRLGRADWSPKSLTIVGNNLENAVLRYSSGDDPFYDTDANDIDASQKTSLEWSWEDVNQPILPAIKELATYLPVLSTGELPGASANSPFLWQMGKLTVDKDALEKTEPGIWIRYRVDPLPEDENLLAQEFNGNGDLSRPLRFDKFRLNDGSAIEHWRLDLSLLPNTNQPSQDISTPQIWLELLPVKSERHTIGLTFLKARIRAASPKILALRSLLTDPGALPNQSDRFAGLQPSARILFANDRTESASNLQDRRALQMTLGNAGAIRLNAWNDAPDVVIAYVPGPVAGIDLISRSRGNLVPAPNTNPNSPPLPTRVREYESGRVAVHLIKGISLEAGSSQAQADELTDTVRVGSIADLFMPSSETVAALLPWALSRINEDQFDKHQFAPFHRNLILEALDWELSAPDRHAPQLDSAPPLLDPGLQEPDNRSRDYRYEEALLSLERAVRDRFASATSQPLAEDNTAQTLANWLPGVDTFKFEDQTLTPQVKLKLAASGSLTALPSLEFNWQNSDPANFPLQTLALTPSPADFTVDVAANTLICPTHGLRDGMGIQLVSTGKLPSGLSTETTYFVVNSDQDTFQLAITQAGSPIDLTDAGQAINSWFVVSNNWLSAWLRWTEGQPNKPQLQVDLDGQNAARLATNSDVPLIEYRTPITAVTASCLNGRYWVFIAVNTDKGSTIKIWEPLSEENPNPKPLVLATLDQTPIDFLAVDAKAESLVLAVVQQTKCSVFEFAAPQKSKLIENPLSSASLNVGAKITTVRLLCQRLFIGTETGANTFSVYKLASGGLDLVFQGLAGKVLTLDVRVVRDGSKLIVAVGNREGEVKLYGWDALPIDGTPTFSPDQSIPNRSPIFNPNILSGEVISAVAIQPLTLLNNIYVYAYTAVLKGDGTGRIVTWPITSISGDTPKPFEGSETETLGEKLLRTLTEPVSFLLSDPIFNNNEILQNGAPDVQWFTAVTTSNTNGKPSILTWPISTWLSQNKLSAAEIEKHRPQVNSPIHFGNHEGTITAIALIPGRSQHASNLPQSADFTVDVAANTLSLTTHGLKDGTGIKLISTGTLPSGLSANKTFYVINSTPKIFQLAEVLGGIPINITDVGSLVHTWFLVSDPNISSESRFATWVVTGGKDGTVRVWDPETGFERFCHTVTPSNAWLDTLGVVRRKIEPVQGSGFWIELIDVPTGLEGNSGNEQLLALSTLGEPFPLFKDPVSNTAMRFLCQNLHLKSDSEKWIPIQFTENSTSHTFRHGIYGCDGDSVNPMPRIGGVPVEIIRLKELTFETSDKDLNVGQFVNLLTIVFEALLSNPALPDGNSVPFSSGTSTINIHFKRASSSDDFQISLENSDFDWSFSLTEQLPLGKASVLPGRLAQITGKVTLDADGYLKLEPDVAQAEILGALRPVPNPPSLVFDRGNENNTKQIRFRESLTDDEAKLEQSSNLLLSASNSQDAQIVATSIGTDPFGEEVVLTASQAADPNQKGSAMLAEIETGQTRTRFAEGLKQIQLIVEDVPTVPPSKRLTVVGVAEDGTVRVQRLWDIKLNSSPTRIIETEIEPSLQNWVHYILPSPAENVQVFEVDKKPRLWLLARCRDGSAWLWDSMHGDKYDLSLPDTAVTAIVFGPQIPTDVFDSTKEEYQHWRGFFGKYDTEFITDFDTVIAIGGADGSIHLYAIANEKKPVLVRSFFALNNPIQSLSLAIDEKSSEARTLVKIGNRAAGLVLLACDGNNPVQLIEILSGLTLTPLKRESLPLPLQEIGLLGEIFFDDGELRIILKTLDKVDKEKFSISTLSKKIQDKRNLFEDLNSLELSGISPIAIDHIFAKNGLLTVVSRTDEGGWNAYERDGNKFEIRAKGNTKILNATTCEVSLSSFKQRYIVTILPNGALETWVQKDPDGRGAWTLVKSSNLNHPAHIDNALLGLVTTPMVACYGKPARLGHIWDINDGMSTISWPKEIGSLDANAPVAITSFNGIPHLAVAQPSDVTVWNLAIGQLVYRLGIEQTPVAIDIASDLNQIWLLVGKESNNKFSYEIFNVLNNLSKDVPSQQSLKDNIDARFISLPAGLHLFVSQLLIDATGEVTTTTLKTQIFRPSLVKEEITLFLQAEHIATFPAPTAGEFKLLDATSFNNQEFWLLALVKPQPPGSPQLLVIPIKSGVDLIFPITSTDGSKLVAAAFDIDPVRGDPELPLVWTVNDKWDSVTQWSLPPSATVPSAPTPEATITERGRPPGLKDDESPAHLQPMRHNGRTRLIAVSAGGLAIWDLFDKTVVQTTLLEQAIPRIVPMAISAAVGVDTKAGCVRFWDQYTGRLRQRLFIKNTDLAKPNQLVVVPSPTRPLLVIAGADKGVAIVDLYSNGLVTLVRDLSVSSLSAALMLSGVIPQNKHLVVAGIVSGVGVQVWRSLLGQESNLFDDALKLSGFPTPPQAVELLRLENRTLLTVADSKELKIFDIPQDTPSTSISITPATSSDVGITPSVPDFNIINVRLSHAIDQDCVLVALALKSTSNTRIELHDLPLRKEGMVSSQRPATKWFTDKNIDDKLLPGVIALICNNDGPRVVAGTEVFRTASLLRIYNNQPPRFDLPVKILNADSFLKGRITASRRLDLQISLDRQKLGLPEEVVRLTARANLIQGSYSCFMIDGIDYGDFRLTGALVLWENLNLSSRDFQGLLLIDDTNIITKAKVEIPSKSVGSLLAFEAYGTRVRLRAIPFDATSTTIDKLSWREVISWYLMGNSSTQLKTEWHLADAILDVTGGESASNLQIVQAYLSSSDTNSIQGNLLVTLKRNVDANEEYTLSLNPTTYAIHAFDDLNDSKFDTTKNDFVYPAGTKGSLGLAFDLVEPPSNMGNQSELFQFATLLADGGIAKLFAVQPDELPLDLNTGRNVTRALPKHSISVPQLIHREAQGARIRGHWPSVFETLKQPIKLGDGLLHKQWFLSPVAVTPQGAMVLTQNLLIRPKGKPLDWARLQTECVLTVYRDGRALFASPSSKSDVESPSIVNLLTKTVLRSSGAIAQNSIALFDDEQVQSFALKTGTKGVLLVRTSDGRGRVSYRLVNSPYYSLTPLTVKPSIENQQSASPAPAPKDQGPEIFPDPRLLPPKKVSELKLQGTPRYEPIMASGDRPKERAFQIFGKVPENTLPVIYLAEVPTLKATDKPITPINFEDSRNPDTFLPLTLELGYGLTKPGGTFHQMIQCLSKENLSLSPAPLTTFARREPQQFTPPLRATIQLNNPTLKQNQNNKLEVKIPWTEILGSITLQNNELIADAEFAIKYSAGSVPPYFIDTPVKVLKWIVRLGEKIQILDGILPVPFTPFQNDKSVDFFDLFIFTRLSLEGDRTLPDGITVVKPILVVSHDSELKTIPLDSIFTKIPVQQGDYAIWQLKRDVKNLQIFLSWLKDLKDVNEFALNLIWWDSTPIDIDSIPKLKPLILRDVVYEPQSPRLAAVLRLPPSAGQGVLAPTHEFTLFYGPSASAKGITPVINTSGDQALIQFVANDEERLILANPLPTRQFDCGLSIVKFFEDGATLTTSKLIQLNTES